VSQRQIAVFIAVTSLTNLALVAAVLWGRPAPFALAQTSGAGGGFVLGTEHASDGPVCFVLRGEKPHLLLYKSDSQGQLQLTSSRSIDCDLLLTDNFFARGAVKGALRTQPPVKEICAAVKELREKEQKEKDKEKPAAKGAAEKETETDKKDEKHEKHEGETTGKKE